MHECNTIREWFLKLKIDYALIDGTFWDKNELGGRDMTEIPHPTIVETLNRLGKRVKNDVEIFFFHLNHTNPALNTSSKETSVINGLGWKVLTERQVFSL
jgi:pyrroloquinoline quinone biosynthesis protein B